MEHVEHKSTGAVYIYDFTCFDVSKSPEQFGAMLRLMAKKWSFNHEEATTTLKQHYQGRVSLYKKCRPAEVAKLMMVHQTKAHWSRTSAKGARNFDYVKKTDTQIAGPWHDTDPEPRKELKCLKGKLCYPWQQSIVNDMKEEKEDSRHVNVVISLAGNIGGSWLAKYLWYNRIATIIPPNGEAKTVMSWALKYPGSAYYVDIPRATSYKVLCKLWLAIEMLKDGKAIEERYTPQEDYRDCPVVWVKMNTLPDKKALSADRWKFWQINEKQELVEYVF